MRKLFLFIVVILSAAYIYYSLAEFESILATLRQSNPGYLVAAIFVEITLLFNSAATFSALYQLVGLSEDRKHLMVVVTAGTFVGVVTPVAGVGGAAVMLDDARQRGLAKGRVLVAGVLYTVYEYVSLFAALAAGFFVLFQRERLNPAELAAAGCLLVLAVSLASAVAVGYLSIQRLQNLLLGAARWINRRLIPVFHKPLLNVDTLSAFTDELGDGFAALRANRRQLLFPLFFTLNNKLLLILVLALSFRALGITVDAGTILAGFSIGHLFFYASPTPSGAGFVEGILPLALSSLGLAFSQAVLVSLVYRAVSFWLPLLVGMMAFRSLQKAQRLPAGYWEVAA